MYFRFKPQPHIVLTIDYIHIAHCIDDGIMTRARGNVICFVFQKTKSCVSSIACVRLTNSINLCLFVNRENCMTLITVSEEDI